ncbi:MAG TPA: hypothetical protein VGD55_13230 [Acidothermaceae bacterium]
MPVVTDVDADLPDRGVEDRKAEIAGPEVELLPEAVDVREVVLAVLAEVFAVGVEDLGDDDFYGTTYFVDPEGKFVGDVGDPYSPDLVVRDLDMDLLTEVRNRWAFYRDRRPEAYGDLTRP